MASRNHKLAAAGSALLIAEPALAFAHTGGVGVIVGIAAAVMAYHAVEDIERATGRELPSLPSGQQKSSGKPSGQGFAYRLLNGKSVRDPRDEQAEDEQESISPVQVDEAAGVFPIYEDDETLCIGKVVATSQRFDPHIDYLLGNGLIASAVQGSGKSMLIGLLIEQAGKCGAPTIVIDPKGEYESITDLPFINGLKARAEGGDFLLTPDNADEFVRLVMTQRKQATVNLRSYGSSWLAKARIVAAVGSALMRYADTQISNGLDVIPCLVFVDEAQLYFPQNVQLLPPEAQANKDVLGELSNAYFSLVSNGRSNGYTMCFATQSLTYIAKWAIKSCQIKVLMRHAENNDLDMCERIIPSDIATRADIETFPAGVGVVFGFTTRPVVVKFDTKQSKDRSSTPGIDRVRAGSATSLQVRGPATPRLVQSPSRPKTLSLDAILALADKVDEATFMNLINQLPDYGDYEDDEEQDEIQYDSPSQDRSSRMMANLPMENPNASKLTKYHRLALDAWQPGMGYRGLGELINVGKDKAGDLIKDLRKWGYLDDEAAE